MRVRFSPGPLLRLTGGVVDGSTAVPETPNKTCVSSDVVVASQARNEEATEVLLGVLSAEGRKKMPRVAVHTPITSQKRPRQGTRHARS